jgi:hypothetical protein
MMPGVSDIRVLNVAKKLAGDNFSSVIEEALALQKKELKTPSRALADALHKFLNKKK